MIFVVSMLSAVIGGMGIGGGVVLIPALTMLFGIAQKQVQFINLIYFVPLSLCALAVHKKEGNLKLKKAIPMAIGGVLGAVLGSYMAFVIKTGLLRRLFGVFLLIVGIGQFKSAKKENTKET